MAAAALALASVPRTAQPAQIDFLRVVQEDRGYQIALDASIDAPRQRVFAVLSDFAHLERINPEIVASSFAASSSGGGRVRTVIHSCVLFFCRDLVQVEDVKGRATETITARIVPGSGDFSGGSSLWRLSGEGATTHVHYEATRKLSFWVPPLIARMAARHAIGERFKVSLQELERLARRSP